MPRDDLIETTSKSLGDADSLHALGDFSGAIATYLEVLHGDDSSIPAWWGLGSAFASRNQHAAAVQCFLRLVELAPGAVEAHHNLGKCLFELGEIDAALDAFRKAVLVAPNPKSLGMIAMIIPGSPRASLKAILDARQAWAAILPVTERPARLIQRGDGPIRVGYVSSFLHRRNWMKPVWGLINAQDRDRFRVVLFSDAPSASFGQEYRRDEHDTFVDITGKSNVEVAQLVRKHHIHILVDLNAYSRFERLPLFALRPAPVQIEWFNLFATSGMTCFDALIGDNEVIQPEDAAFFTERLIRAPGCYLTFEVGYPVPEVAPSPSSSGKAFTFGCLAPQYKICPEVIQAWAAILEEATRSRLNLKSSFLGIEGNREYLRDKLVSAGIDLSRVTFDGPAEHFAFLKAYEDIDLVLDTFPYNGGTTTTEALWQGVPTLTFAGDRWIGRISATLLRHAGLGEYVADDLPGYIRQAIAIANDPEMPSRLGALRTGLREKLRTTSVCDVNRFARSMESIYLKLWNEQKFES